MDIALRDLGSCSQFIYSISCYCCERHTPRVATMESLGRSLLVWTQPTALSYLSIMKHFMDVKTVQRAHTLEPEFPSVFPSKLPYEQDSLTISYGGSQHCTVPSETHAVTECDMPPYQIQPGHSRRKSAPIWGPKEALKNLWRMKCNFREGDEIISHTKSKNRAKRQDPELLIDNLVGSLNTLIFLIGAELT